MLDNGISIERLKQFFKLESQALSREIKFDDIVDKVISRRFDRNPVVVGMSECHPLSFFPFPSPRDFDVLKYCTIG